MTREEAIEYARRAIDEFEEKSLNAYMEARDEPSEYEYYMEDSYKYSMFADALRVLIG